jgi:hypothetical protein
MANPIEFEWIHGKRKVVAGVSRVRLIFDGAVTRAAIRKLRQYLELAEDDCPSKTSWSNALSKTPRTACYYRDA